MRLFDSTLRTDDEPKGYAEPLFNFLNRCAWRETETIRATLEKWYAEYPGHGQTELRNRLRSTDNFNYHSALFELVLHAALVRLGCTVEIHPASQTSRHPDFWVRDSEPFFLEAAVVSDESVQQRSANQRMNVVYDALNRLRSPDFFIGLELIGYPQTPPSARTLKRFLMERLRCLDYATVCDAFGRAGDLDCAPRWRYEHAGWTIDFFPIPKSANLRGKPGIRPIAAFFGEAKWRVGCAALWDTINKKAGRYGRLDSPFVIAVNVIGHTDDIDVKDALFGRECLEVTTTEDSIRKRESCLKDGIWSGPKGPRNTKVSAVLAVFGLRHANIANVRARVYHNPWAARRFNGKLNRFSQLARAGNRMVEISGAGLGEILGLPSSWPHLDDSDP